MKTNVEVLESGATKLTVTVEAAEVSSRIKKAYKDFGNKYKFPGFRPGHVPRQIIDNNLGKEAVLSSITEDMLNDTFPVAIDEADVYMISQPKFVDTDALVEDGKDYVYAAEFEVKPAIELSDYAPVHVEVPFKTASEAEIDEQVKALSSYYYDYSNAPANTKVKEDSAVELAIKAIDDDGEEISALCADERLYELNQGLFPAAFDAELVGMKKGESKYFEIEVDGNPCMLTSILQGKTKKIVFDVEVKVVKKKTSPEFTDEWIKENLGMENMEELRKRFAEQIETQKADIIPRVLENNALYALQQRLEGEAPQSMIDDAERDLLQSFFEQLQRQGGTLDAYLAAQKITADQFKEDVKAQAADTVKQNLALDAYARHAGITVTDDEVHTEFLTSGAKDAEKLYADWKKQGRLHTVREGIMRGKALEALLKEADVEEVETPKAAAEEEKPAKKAAAKKSTAKKADKDAGAAVEKKPAAKKTTAKKAPAKTAAKKTAAKKDAEAKAE